MNRLERMVAKAIKKLGLSHDFHETGTVGIIFEPPPEWNNTDWKMLSANGATYWHYENGKWTPIERPQSP